MAKSRLTDPERGTSMFSAHFTLAHLALHNNEVASAVAHLDAATKVPPSDELKYGSSFYWQSVATELLKRGERESVARFLSELGAMRGTDADREQLTESAARIRAGKMPDFYQYQTVPR